MMGYPENFATRKGRIRRTLLQTTASKFPSIPGGGGGGGGDVRPVAPSRRGKGGGKGIKANNSSAETTEPENN